MLYSISQQKIRGFDFYWVIYFTFFAAITELTLPWGNQTAKFYFFCKLVKKNNLQIFDTNQVDAIQVKYRLILSTLGKAGAVSEMFMGTIWESVLST